MSVDPCSDIVSPLRNVNSIFHFSMLGPQRVWQNPVPVDHSGIKPVSFKWNNLDRVVNRVKSISFSCIFWNLPNTKSSCVVELGEREGLGLSVWVMSSPIYTERLLGPIDVCWTVHSHELSCLMVLLLKWYICIFSIFFQIVIAYKILNQFLSILLQGSLV